MKKDDFVYKELKTQEMRLEYIKGAVQGNVVSRAVPRRVFIEPTNYCNCKCVHCPSVKHMTRPRGYMDFSLFTKIIDELGPLWPYVTINLYQHGEPLLHPRIYDMIDYAQGYNLFVKLNTNLGALRKKDIGRLLNVNYLEISVDAACTNTYRAIKNVDRFEKVLGNLLDFLEAWGETSSPASYACDVSFLSQSRNQHVAEIFEDMFSRLPIGHVNIYNLHNFTGAIEEGGSGLPDRQNIPRKDWPCCNTPWDIMGINWDGKAVACVYDYNGRYIIGDTNTMSVMECWNSEEMQRFRQGLLNRDYSDIEKNGPMCTECSIMWLPDYALPTNFYQEIKRMPQYIDRAVARVADQFDRHAELMEKWRYLKENRTAWTEELLERTEQAHLMLEKGGTRS